MVATSITSSIVVNSLAFFTTVEPNIFLFTKLGSASALYKNGRFPISLLLFSKLSIQEVNSSFVPLSMSTPPMSLSLMNLSIESLDSPSLPTAGIIN